ncbi:hypothetical protein HDV05_000594 [Chytridiales sp. JEL 0842]|nr:hypothetical protein HDV05_000594 [Chytridiales sp. JEL 0842]
MSGPTRLSTEMATAATDPLTSVSALLAQPFTQVASSQPAPPQPATTDPTPPPKVIKKRNRISKSCTTCSKRKRKCDFQKPTCSRCISLNTPCVYPPLPDFSKMSHRPGRPPKTPWTMYTDSLRMRIKEVEIKLKLLGVEVPPPKPLPGGLDGADEGEEHTDGYNDGMDEHDELQQMFPPSKVGQAAIGSSGQHPTSSSSVSHQNPLQQSERASLPDPDIYYPGMVPIKMECANERRKSTSIASDSAPGSAISSSMPPISTTTLREGYSSLLPGAHVAPIQRFFENSEKDLQALGPDIYKELLMIFFENIYHIRPYSFLHPPTILSGEQKLSPLLLDAIGAYAASYSTNPIIRGWKVLGGDFTAGQPFFEKARKTLIDELDRPSLQTVQALMFLGCYAFQSGRASTGWQYWCIMTCMAQELQLDVDPDVNCPGMGWLEKETRRRTWWLVWEFDREIPMFCFRPKFIQNFPTIKRPAPEYAWVQVQTLDATPPAAWLDPIWYASDPLHITISLLNILDAICDSVKDLNLQNACFRIMTTTTSHDASCTCPFDNKPAYFDHLSRMPVLLSQISTWHTQLPTWISDPPSPHLRYEPGLLSTPDKPTWSIVHLHVIHHTCLLMTYLPSALCAFARGQASIKNGEGEQSVLAIYKSSKEVVRLCRDVIFPQNPRFWHLHNFMNLGIHLSAVGLLMLAMVEGSDVGREVLLGGGAEVGETLEALEGVSGPGEVEEGGCKPCTLPGPQVIAAAGSTFYHTQASNNKPSDIHILIGALEAFGKITVPPLRLKASLLSPWKQALRKMGIPFQNSSISKVPRSLFQIDTSVGSSSSSFLSSNTASPNDTTSFSQPDSPSHRLDQLLVALESEEAWIEQSLKEAELALGSIPAATNIEDLDFGDLSFEDGSEQPQQGVDEAQLQVLMEGIAPYPSPFVFQNTTSSVLDAAQDAGLWGPGGLNSSVEFD